MILSARDIGARLRALSVWSFAYYTAFSLYVMTCFLRGTAFETVFGISKEGFVDAVQVAVLALLLAKFSSQRMSLRNWAIAITIVLVGFVSWRQASEGWLFWLAMFVACSEGISIRVLAGIVLGVDSMMLLVTVVCAFTGMVENLAFVRQGVSRQAFGFAHPNSFGNALMMICVSFSALRFGRNPLPDIALLVVAMAVNLQITNSRTSALIAAFQIALLLAFYLARTPSRQRLMSLLCVGAVTMAVFASFYFMVFYDASNPFHSSLNSILSGRLCLAYSYYQMQPLTLFGSDFSQFEPIYWENGESYQFVVDNAFCHLLLRYGIVPTMIFLTGLFALLVKLVREGRWDATLFGVTIMLICGFAETRGISINSNFFLVAMGVELLFQKDALVSKASFAAGGSTLTSAGSRVAKDSPMHVDALGINKATRGKIHEHESFFKNTLWQYGLQILRYLLPLALVPYLTRALGTDGYAVYAYVLSFMGVVQVIADFGFTLSGTRKVVERRDDAAALSKLVGDITAARLILLAALLASVLAISAFIPIMAENAVYVTLAFVAVGLRALLPDFLFQGLERMGPLTTRYFASKGTQVLLTLLIVRSPDDLLLVALADIVGSAIGLAWSLVTAKGMFGVGVAVPSPRRSLRELRDSAIYCVSNVSSSVLSGFTTIIIGLALTDRDDLAFWSLALTTVSAVQALYAPITNSLYPHMLSSCDFRFARRLALLAAPALAVGTIAYCLLSEPIALMLGGEGYEGAARVMLMLAPVLPLSFYAMLIGWPILGAMGHVKELTVSTVLAGALSVVAMLSIYLAGMGTLGAICAVRCLSEAALLAARAVALYPAVRKRAHSIHSMEEGR